MQHALFHRFLTYKPQSMRKEHPSIRKTVWYSNPSCIHTGEAPSWTLRGTCIVTVTAAMVSPGLWTIVTLSVYLTHCNMCILKPLMKSSVKMLWVVRRLKEGIYKYTNWQSLWLTEVIHNYWANIIVTGSWLSHVSFFPQVPKWWHLVISFIRLQTVFLLSSLASIPIPPHVGQRH